MPKTAARRQLPHTGSAPARPPFLLLQLATTAPAAASATRYKPRHALVTNSGSHRNEGRNNDKPLGPLSSQAATHKMHLTLSPGRTARKAAAAHARSASQPCGKRSHPALTRLDGALRALSSWSAVSESTSSSSSSYEGLELVEAALAALCDLLATPRATAALHSAPATDDDRVLDARSSPLATRTARFAAKPRCWRGGRGARRRARRRR
ncbi:hypothetical protein PR202_ga07553 [Eleusine coracana subsp. coracana]|uniref:Uncharacterized protein n=1 Tax=Eleusine coracana subsp. coracana TaxID=191504 RepID=A0AAV5BXY6_ELECO|nr:hypothetical protein PR202_ga07553 [Eleusine coracana subsp. coracana]